MSNSSALRARGDDDGFSIGDPTLNSRHHRRWHVAATHRREHETARDLARSVEEACIRSGGGEDDVDGRRQSIRSYNGGRWRHLAPENQFALVQNAKRPEARTLKCVQQMCI